MIQGSHSIKQHWGAGLSLNDGTKIPFLTIAANKTAVPIHEFRQQLDQNKKLTYSALAPKTNINKTDLKKMLLKALNGKFYASNGILA